MSPAGRGGTATATTVGRLLADAERRLAARDVEFPDASALWLLAHVLGALDDPDALETAPGRVVAPSEIARFEALLERRLAHEPFQYIVGVADFRDRLMEVEPGVFLPRSQSERLCDEIEEWAAGRPALEGGWRIADLGTGCGAMAVSLALGPMAPARVLAVDLAPRAARLAGRNARRHGVADRVRPLVGDWLGMIRPDPVLDVVCAVPPYLNPGDEEYLSEETLRWEPLETFIGQPSGDDQLRRIVDEATARLAPGGLLACQIEGGQAEWVEAWVNGDPDHPLTIEWVLYDEDDEAEAFLAVRG